MLNLQQPSMSKGNGQQGIASNEKITSGSMIAIVVIIFTGCWVAFAYYRNPGADDSQPVLLLHPIVAVLLIALLVRVRKLIEVSSIVYILIFLLGLILKK